jgi:hypothetical protein
MTLTKQQRPKGKADYFKIRQSSLLSVWKSRFSANYAHFSWAIIFSQIIIAVPKAALKFGMEFHQKPCSRNDSHTNNPKHSLVYIGLHMVLSVYSMKTSRILLKFDVGGLHQQLSPYFNFYGQWTIKNPDWQRAIWTFKVSHKVWNPESHKQFPTFWSNLIQGIFKKRCGSISFISHMDS